MSFKGRTIPLYTFNSTDTWLSRVLDEARNEVLITEPLRLR